jgi:hypothetical protein
MPRFRYAGGDQRPDDYGVLEPGDVLEFAKKPEWGDWESTSDDPLRQPTPQPVVEPEPVADTRTRPKPVDDVKEA